MSEAFFSLFESVTSMMDGYVHYPRLECAMNGLRVEDIWDGFYSEPKKITPAVRERLRGVAKAFDLVVPNHRQQEQLAWYMGRWQSDCYVAVGDFAAALEAYPVPKLGSRASMNIDKILTLKLAVGEPPSGFDLLTLFGPKVTKWAREHIVELAGLVDTMLTTHANTGQLLARWAAITHVNQWGYDLFSGRAYISIKNYSFSLNAEAEAFTKDIAREAENVLRKRRGIPAVGEGWVEETALFYAIKEALPTYRVHHHYTAQWLGRQHLDIYIEDLDLGIEYQGEQHDRPVEFFGGEEGWRMAQERDARKRRLCRQYGVHLLEVRPGYDLRHLVDQISAAAPR
jgi:hypothetical protein